jgi:hypothetical protein
LESSKEYRSRQDEAVQDGEHTMSRFPRTKERERLLLEAGTRD